MGSSTRCLGGTTNYYVLAFLLISSATQWNLTSAANYDQHNIQDYIVPYEETPETFVEYPTDAASQQVVKQQKVATKVPLNLWTTPIDFRHPLLYLIKGIVRRLDNQLLEFNPQYFLADGVALGCRSVLNSTAIETEDSSKVAGCQNNCTNVGRYCAAALPDEDSGFSAEITGADIVEESLRRLCGMYFVTYRIVLGKLACTSLPNLL